jgi:hypothetical protein
VSISDPEHYFEFDCKTSFSVLWFLSPFSCPQISCVLYLNKWPHSQLCHQHLTKIIVWKSFLINKCLSCLYHHLIIPLIFPFTSSPTVTNLVQVGILTFNTGRTNWPLCRDIYPHSNTVFVQFHCPYPLSP